jgi:hypothetical protein
MNDSATGRFKKGSIPWNKGKYLTQHIEVKCLYCGRKRLVTPSVIKFGRGKFCSPKCQYSYSRPCKEETKKKISLANKGKTSWIVGIGHSTETKKKISLKNSGENNPAWKGGVSIFNKEIRRSSQYKKWRKAVLKRDNYTCQICGRKNCKLEADHIKSFVDYPELRLDINNGRALCKECHRQTPTWGYKKMI